MASNAFVLSPYRNPPTESNNEFESIELQRFTSIPAAATDHIRVTGGPTTTALPTLTVADESGTVGFLYTLSRTAYADHEITDGTNGFTVGGSYGVTLHGPICTVTWQISWSGKGSASGAVYLNFPSAPNPSSDQTVGMAAYAHAQANMQPGIVVCNLPSAVANLRVQIFPIGDTTAATPGLVDASQVSAASSVTAGGTYGTVTYPISIT